MPNKGKALVLVTLFLIGSVCNIQPDIAIELSNFTNDKSTDTMGEIWNETPLDTIAVPTGFNRSKTVDYSDVVVLINNQSDASKTIGWAFVSARNISSERVFLFENSSTPTGETINREQFNKFFLEPFREFLGNYNGSDINYLVTTKGVPLRINGGNDKASFDQEIALAGGTYDSDIGADYWGTHSYGPLAGKEIREFTRDEYGFFLVTRLTGYTIDTALGLIEKANNSYGSRGVNVLDLATNQNGSGSKFWNDDLYAANNTLNGSMNLPVFFDEESDFVTNISNVIGYASWGSNDGNWNNNYLLNGGFDTLDNSWESGSKYWNWSSPNVAQGDVFNWSYQTDVKQGGNGAFEAEIVAQCTQESGYLKPGLLAEYFDNEGVSFSTASMPDLIDRTPEHTRIETSLAYSSSGNAYPGLDDRFKNNWGARFSGLIDIQETGNWTFYLDTDDGSELWVNGASLIQNYGSHGMREISGSINLSEGFHDFKIEFFQGGGPHGLRFSYEGPNTSKTTIPASAFFVSGDYIPKSENLVHKWDFEEGAGQTASDYASNNSNFTLYGMDNTNWRNCIDGKCLWFDGTDDYAKVNVDDWLGNFTVSQWVWANNSNQSNYASTFAIDDNAGSNSSFQHMISGGEWKLHNNQTRTFGDVIPQKWTNLVTVFDNGYTKQYMDGVLVNTNTYPNGSLNNFDLYKLGVNRAGNSYYEGKIDSVMIWDTALDNNSITVLSRNVIDNCSAYSGNGAEVAYLETSHTIDTNFTDHAWVVYTQGKREGDVFGKFKLQVTSVDINGSELYENISSSKNFNNAWGTQTMRFRPHADAVSMKIRISIDITTTSTDGGLYLDSTVLRVIRPSMDWIDGSIAETAVSTGARSFKWGTSYGQSLIADILEDGVSGAKGYVYEPYLTAVSYPSILLSSYSSGFNLAESYAASNNLIGWMGVVVGDPKMSPYANIVHDAEIIDVRVVDNVSNGQQFSMDVAIQNLGPGVAVGNLKVIDKLGGEILENITLSLPSGNELGSRQIISLSLNSTRSGWNNLIVKWEATSILHPERDINNNQVDFLLWVNNAPVVDRIYCDSAEYSRGDRFVCSLEASDDSGIESATIGWRITTNNNSTEWIWKNTGSQDGVIWWTSIDLPSNVPLGLFDLKVNVTDASNQSTLAEALSIAEITDAPATWFGIHISTVDDPDWGGASILTSFPINGVTRGHILTLKACALDPDHDPVNERPQFISTRGQIDGLSYRSGSSNDQHCYVASFNLSPSSSLDSFNLELRGLENNLLTRRTIQVTDMPPFIDLKIVDSLQNPVENILAGGDEYLLVEVSDFDDSVSEAYGDVTIRWPGQPGYTNPFQLENGLALIQLSTAESIDNGDLFIQVNVTGANGGSNFSTIISPILLSPPEILDTKLCKDGVEIDTLMFGQYADAVLRVKSSRPVKDVSSTIEQFGWTVIAPPQTPIECGQSMLEQTNEYHFRVTLDSSFVPGNGSLGFRVMDIDDITAVTYMPFIFMHSPPEINVTFERNLTSQALMEVLVEMTDADGIDAVCGLEVYQNESELFRYAPSEVVDINGFGVWSVSWLLPVSLSDQINFVITCEDWSGNIVRYSDVIMIDSSEECLENCDLVKEKSEQSSDFNATYAGIILLVILILSLFITLKSKKNNDEVVEQWQSDDVAPIRDERIPEGWTLQEFIAWLDGPIPEEWEETQWEDYRKSLEDLR